MNTGPNYENFKSPRVCGMFYFLPEFPFILFEKESFLLYKRSYIQLTLQI